MTTQSNTQTSQPITFDEVFTLIEHWRENKNAYEGTAIPDDIWLKIFELENSGKYTAIQIRRLIGLSTQQYKNKQGQLLKPAGLSSNPQKSVSKADSTPNNPASQQPDFCEAIVSPVPALTPEETKKAAKTNTAIKQLKTAQHKPEHYLDTSTIIVEYILPNGHRLKIHTTTHSIDHIIQSFGADSAPLS